MYTLGQQPKNQTKQKQKLSLMYTMYVNASINTPSYTHISSYIVCRFHPPGKKHSYVERKQKDLHLLLKSDPKIIL